MENQASESHGDLINTFTEITSSSREEALFFLESHNFDLDSAVSTFLETTAAAATVGDVSASPGQNQSPSQSLSPASSPSRSRSPSPPPQLRPQASSLYNLRSGRQNQPSGETRATRSRTGRIHTFSDLNRTDGGGASDSDSDEPQEYYTGGEKRYQITTLSLLLIFIVLMRENLGVKL